MNHDYSAKLLKKTINSIRMENVITVEELIATLKTLDPKAKVFVYDRYEQCDVPLTKEDIYGSDDENEVYFFDEV